MRTDGHGVTCRLLPLRPSPPLSELGESWVLARLSCSHSACRHPPALSPRAVPAPSNLQSPSQPRWNGTRVPSGLTFALRWAAPHPGPALQPRLPHPCPFFV